MSVIRDHKSEAGSLLFSLCLSEEVRTRTWSLKNWVKVNWVTASLSFILPMHRKECADSSSVPSVVRAFHHLYIQIG